MDLCPDDFDPEQVDRDGDGAGDACDPDPGRFNLRLTGARLLLVGGQGMTEADDLEGAATAGAHTSTAGESRLTGRLLP